MRRDVVATEEKSSKAERMERARKRQRVASIRGVDVDDAKELVRHLRERDAEEVPAEPRIYVVKPGDNLSKIARELLGDASRWSEIYEANKDRIEDPNLIHPGQELDIPS